MNCGSYTRLAGLFLLRLSTREEELVLDQYIKRETEREARKLLTFGVGEKDLHTRTSVARHGVRG